MSAPNAVYNIITDRIVKLLESGRAQRIAREAGLDGKPLSAYVALIQECKNSMREALSRIEGGAMVSA